MSVSAAFPSLLFATLVALATVTAGQYTLTTTFTDPRPWNSLATWADNSTSQSGTWSFGSPYCCTVPGVAGTGGSVVLAYNGVASCAAGTDTMCEVQGSVVDGVVMSSLTMGSLAASPRPIRLTWTDTMFTSTSTLTGMGAASMQLLVTGVSASKVVTFLSGGSVAMTSGAVFSVRTTGAGSLVWSGILFVNSGAFQATLSSNSTTTQLPTIVVNPPVAGSASAYVTVAAGGRVQFQNFVDVRKNCDFTLDDSGAATVLTLSALYIRGGRFIYENRLTTNTLSVAALGTVLSNSTLELRLRGGGFALTSLDADAGALNVRSTVASLVTLGSGVLALGADASLNFFGPMLTSVAGMATAPLQASGLVAFAAPTTFLPGSSVQFIGDFSKLRVPSSASTRVTFDGLSLESGTEVQIAYSSNAHRMTAQIHVTGQVVLQGALVLNVSAISSSVAVGSTAVIMSYATRPTGSWTQVIVQGWPYTRILASSIEYQANQAVLTFAPFVPTTQCTNEFGQLLFGQDCLSAAAPPPPPPVLAQIVAGPTLKRRNVLSPMAVMAIVLASDVGIALVLGIVFTVSLCSTRSKLLQSKREAEDAKAVDKLARAAPTE